MRYLPVRRRTFSLLDDKVDGGVCRSKVGDRVHRLKVDCVPAQLTLGPAQEEGVAAEMTVERGEVGADRLLQMTDRGVILRARHQPGTGLLPLVVVLDERVAVFAVETLRPLQKDEMLQRLGGERRKS